MKKWITKILLWDHFCQVMFTLSTIPSIILWIKGHATAWTGFIIGWNWGCAVYWQFYLSARNRSEKWMMRALRQATQYSDEAEGILNQAKHLVEARLQSHHIDPERN